MKAILLFIILAFNTSCGPSVMVQGVKVRDDRAFKQSQKAHNDQLIIFLLSTACWFHFYNPHKK